ncbi:MAG: DUF512 domain-containing protein, partial [Coleofasciculus sp. C2-GNP5-27]
WLADEWFLIAQQELPSESHYEDYPQIGNGVGSIRQFIKQFQDAAMRMLPIRVEPARELTWVVGNAVETAFVPLVQQLNKVEGLEVKLAALRSEYWGQEITVTGLLTGQDLLGSLSGKDFGDGILLPSVMLKHDDTRFLDDMTVAEVSHQLGTKIWVVRGIEELLERCVAKTLN